MATVGEVQLLKLPPVTEKNTNKEQYGFISVSKHNNQGGPCGAWDINCNTNNFFDCIWFRCCCICSTLMGEERMTGGLAQR